MSLTDTHCHLDLNKFDTDRIDVIDRAINAGVNRMLIPAIDLNSSLNIVEIVKNHPNLFAAVGIHPNNAMNWDADSKQQLFEIISQNNSNYSVPGIRKIVGIGEIGLDYYWNDAPPDVQEIALLEQLDLASQFQLPVILHMREKGDALSGECSFKLVEVLTNWTNNLSRDNNTLTEAPGVMHSFSGDLEIAKSVLAMNFFVGVTGPVTYKNAESKREVVKSLPLEKILVETDSPYLAPVPHRGQRNEPAYISHITDKIAEIHKKDPEEIAWMTSENAKRLFSWGG
ncbi:MAG: TatD family hydrolase [Chloroflexota bacterium]